MANCIRQGQYEDHSAQRRELYSYSDINPDAGGHKDDPRSRNIGTHPRQSSAGWERPKVRRTEFEGELYDVPAPFRPVLDPGPSRDGSRLSRNECFLPKDGIDDKVTETETRRYLGGYSRHAATRDAIDNLKV